MVIRRLSLRLLGKMIKVFADFHHADLFNSLRILFEERLGFELYRPVGLDWYTEGYWNVFDALDTAKQFLDLSIGDEWKEIQKKYPGAHFPAQNQNAVEVESECFLIPDITKDTFHRGITLDRFKDERFDIVLSSIPQHIPLYEKLISQYQPQAKHIFQVGNAWGHQPGIKNILASTAPFPVPAGVNACFYHQEFDLNTFGYSVPNLDAPPQICSYIHYMQRQDIFGQYAQLLNEFQFKSFGAGMNSTIMKTADIAEQMKSSCFTWHYKPEGDGFGHIIHNTFAVGRPPIVWGSHYRGKLAESLLIDGETCLDMERRSITENIRMIRDASRPDNYLRMCESVRARFNAVVDYDKEEKDIRVFLDRLL